MRRPPRELKPLHQLCCHPCFSSATSATATLSKPSSSSRGQALRPGLGFLRLEARVGGRIERQVEHLVAALATTKALLDGVDDRPIFEATLQQYDARETSPFNRMRLDCPPRLLVRYFGAFGTIPALARRSAMRANSGSDRAFILRITCPR